MLEKSSIAGKKGRIRKGRHGARLNGCDPRGPGGLRGRVKEHALMDGLDVRVERCNSIVGRITEGDAFLLDEKGKRVHTLNRVGMFIWGLLENGSTLREIARKVSQKFGLSQETAGASTREFLDELAQKGVVRVLEHFE